MLFVDQVRNEIRNWGVRELLVSIGRNKSLLAICRRLGFPEDRAYCH